MRISLTTPAPEKHRFLDLSQISLKICNYARRNLVVSNIICNFAPYFRGGVKSPLE